MSKITRLKSVLCWIVSHGVMLVVLAVVLWGAYTVGRHVGQEPTPDISVAAPAEHAEEVWTCPMHPQIRLADSGDCPICGMALVLAQAESPEPHIREPKKEAEPAGYACAMFCVPPLPNLGKCPVCGMDMVAVHDEPATASASERRLTMSQEARALADIQTAPVVRRHAVRALRVVGMVEADETRLARVTAYVGGRLDRLHVRYTGAQVERGAPLAGLYSPDLLTARAELLQAKQSASRLADSTLASVRDGAQGAVGAARERLRLWGLSEAQVRALESGDAGDAIITIAAPIGGTVIERHVQQGDYVDTGGLIFTVADLSVVWLQLKVYERDMSWMQLDQRVTFTVDAWPSESFQGRVAFIEPVLTDASRTINARVEVDNESGRLKPGMFARAQIEVPVAAPDETPPLLIPDTAPLLTGTRAVVYVAVPDQELPTYEGREILLGPRVDGYYVVKEGLHEGERVVVNGAFRIDSALQIRARPSMMQAEEIRPGISDMSYHDHDVAAPDAPAVRDAPIAPATAPPRNSAMNEALQASLEAYFVVQQALAADDIDAGREGCAALAMTAGRALENIADDAPTSWTGALQTMHEAASLAKDAMDIAAVRRHFLTASNVLIALLEAHPEIPDAPVARVHCPMAFDDVGAAWLQRGDAVRNPYFGASMLQCGVIQQTYGPAEAQ